jgi:hypothetical protein
VDKGPATQVGLNPDDYFLEEFSWGTLVGGVFHLFDKTSY